MYATNRIVILILIVYVLLDPLSSFPLPHPRVPTQKYKTWSQVPRELSMRNVLQKLSSLLIKFNKSCVKIPFNTNNVQIMEFEFTA